MFKLSIRRLLMMLSATALISVLVVAGMMFWMSNVANSLSDSMTSFAKESEQLIDLGQDASKMLGQTLQITAANNEQSLGAQPSKESNADSSLQPQLNELLGQFNDNEIKLYQAKQALLNNRQAIAKLSTQAENQVSTIQTTANSLLGKVSLQEKRQKRAIRRVYQQLPAAPDNAQWRSVTADMMSYIEGDFDKITSAARKLNEGVARLNALTYALQSADNDSAIINLEKNTAAPLLQLIDDQLTSLGEYANSDEELAALVQTITNDKAKLTEQLFGSNSIKSLRSSNIALQHQVHADSIAISLLADELRQLSQQQVSQALANNNQVFTAANNTIKRLNSSSVIVCIIVIVLLALASFAITRFVTKPLDKITSALADIAQGEGDLTRRLQVTGVSEALSMSEYFNKFISRLQETILSVAEVERQLGNTVAATKVIAERSHQNIQRQSSETTSVAAAVEELSQSFADSASAATQALAATQQAYDEANSGQNTVTSSAKTVAQLADRIERGVEAMERLTATSRQVMSVLTVISDITEQTNLLALNAAIEAARAGDHGRGFAVVADEVRQLAGRTQASAKQITEILEVFNQDAQNTLKVMDEGRNQVHESVSSSDEVAQAFSRINSSVLSIRDLNEHIASTTQSQNEAARSAAESVEQINVISEETRGTANEIKSSAEQLGELSDRLHRALNRFRF
ncbi:methyl-accepting chemotaxis protein [Shewanella avicenniae]|uniref:Methyl-accepting chemotaxis protein n=1 Tax=Shewanella avicenniae TaxID=2814294 RepID=A0ABX7QLJ7_9GAMM|nr:methyl-accepting chemotaxis protein [Shewanella avicenniae]QSX32322.1 methyl-accepting chemotaxis protein [Shewanella avicenniae]